MSILKKQERVPERFMGASIPETLYDKVQEIADQETLGKLKWAVVKLLEEALSARGQ